jgi:hypothetical protein
MSKATERETAIVPSNDGLATLAYELPYVAEVELTGVCAILLHAWSVDAVAAKAAAAKGSKAKKTDDLESYVMRDGSGCIGLPGTYLVGAVIEAARYRQDPRSPRKAARDLFRAAVQPLTDLAPITAASGKPATAWDYVDARRAVVQRAGVTRERPALLAGWSATVELQISSPEYVSPLFLAEVLGLAGRLVGVGDFRPTFGRFTVTRFVTREA